MNCGNDGCTNQVLFRCDTCTPAQVYCKQHTKDHLGLMTLHQLTSLHIRVEKEKKEILIMRIEVLLAKVSKTRKDFLFELDKFTKALLKRIELVIIELRETEDMYLGAIERLGMGKLINTAKMNKPEEFIIKMIQDQERVEEEIKLLQNKTLFVNHIILGQDYKEKLEELGILKEKYKKITQLLGGASVLEGLVKEDDPPKINLLTNVKTVTTINVLEDNDTKVEFTKILHNFYSTSYCMINNEEIFCYGYSRDVIQGDDGFRDYYLINIKQRTEMKLGFWKWVEGNALCYLNHLVYSFGGSLHYRQGNAVGSNYSQEAEVFDFKGWRSLAPLPLNNIPKWNCSIIANIILLSTSYVNYY